MESELDVHRVSGFERNLAAEQMDHSIRLERAYLILRWMEIAGPDRVPSDCVTEVMRPALGLPTD